MKEISICIPTYNRRRFLQRLIENILQETKDKSIRSNIEVCIQDNASTDGTDKMVQVYAKKYTFIKYKRNSENIGMDRNISAVLQEARSRYCWLFGDDDIIVPGSLRKIIDLLAKKPKYLIVGFRRPNEVQKTGKLVSIHKGTKEWDELLADIWNTSFIGSHVVERSLAVKSARKIADSYGFGPEALFLQLQKESDVIYRLNTPVIIQESDGIYPTSEKVANVFFMGLPSLLIKERNRRTISDKDFEKMMHVVRRHLCNHLLPVFTVSFKSLDDLKKGRKILLSAYDKFIKGSSEDSLLIKTHLFIMRFLLLYVPAAVLAKIVFEIIYVRFLNLFRKNKMDSTWKNQRRAKQTGVRELDY